MCLVRGRVGRRPVLGRRVDRRQVVVASKDQIQQTFRVYVWSECFMRVELGVLSNSKTFGEHLNKVESI